jgi:hypothetical protein
MSLAGILGVIGSVASVGAIPLSIWLYLRSQESKLLATRREIIRILSFQLGEGRPLSLFEINAVIDSQLRARKLKPGTVTPRVIVDDLVSDTLANPMLAPGRKQGILLELERALIAPTLRQLLERYEIDAHALIGILDRERLLRAGDELVVHAQLSETTAEVAATVQDEGEEPTVSLRSTVFGLLSLITSLIAVMLITSGGIPPARIIESVESLRWSVVLGAGAHRQRHSDHSRQLPSLEETHLVFHSGASNAHVFRLLSGLQVDG